MRLGLAALGQLVNVRNGLGNVVAVGKVPLRLGLGAPPPVDLARVVVEKLVEDVLEGVGLHVLEAGQVEVGVEIRVDLQDLGDGLLDCAVQNDRVGGVGGERREFPLHFGEFVAVGLGGGDGCAEGRAGEEGN